MVSASARQSTGLVNPVDILALELDKFHLKSPDKSSSHYRTNVASSTHGSSFEPLEVIRETSEIEDHRKDSEPSVFPTLLGSSQIEHYRLLAKDPHIRAVVEKHEVGDYDWVLSVPAGFDLREGVKFDDTLYGGVAQYGCNLLMEKKDLSTGNYCGTLANVYTLLATQLTETEKMSTSIPPLDDDTMAHIWPVIRVIPPSDDGIVDDLVDISEPGETSEDSDHPQGEAFPAMSRLNYDTVRSNNVSLKQSDDDGDAPVGALEDVVGQSEDDIRESSDTDCLGDFILSAEEQKSFDSFTFRPTTTSTKFSRGAGAIGQSTFVQTREPVSRPALRKTISVDLKDMVDERSAGTSQATTRKSTLTRPSSRAAKPMSRLPIKPSFELPGEAVARRLKEQREARRLLQMSNKERAVIERPKPTKAPTRPNFELPGEAISRRKQAQREKELHEQEEAERARRQFRATPIRSSVIPSSYPRETAASRARRVKAASEESCEATPQRSIPAPGIPKRTSLVTAGNRVAFSKTNFGNSSTTRAASSALQQPRGRLSARDDSKNNCTIPNPSSNLSRKRSGVGIGKVESQSLDGRSLPIRSKVC